LAQTSSTQSQQFQRVEQMHNLKAEYNKVTDSLNELTLQNKVLKDELIKAKEARGTLTSAGDTLNSVNWQKFKG
jgi:uncharacterized protein YpuA (DUF1002 family)